MAPKDSLKMTIKIKEIVGLLQLEFRKSQAQQESGRGDLGIDKATKEAQKGTKDKKTEVHLAGSHILSLYSLVPFLDLSVSWLLLRYSAQK